MSYADFLTTITTIITAISAMAVLVGFISKNIKNKQVMSNVVITALIASTILTGLFSAFLYISRPTVAVNHYVTLPLPGKPAQTETTNNTVIVATTAPTPKISTKIIKENKTLTCVTGCYSINDALTVVLDRIEITPNDMKWYFIVTNTSTATICGDMQIGVTLQDPSGKQISSGPPGQLATTQTLATGQQIQNEYTTISPPVQSGITYTLFVSPTCFIAAGAIEESMPITF